VVDSLVPAGVLVSVERYPGPVIGNREAENTRKCSHREHSASIWQNVLFNLQKWRVLAQNETSVSRREG
jgi:hypothetical protein